MTHGEAYYHRKNNIDFSHDLDKILRNFERLPMRMPRKQALEYYGNKIRNFFGVEEVKRTDFRKIEEYYDYFEAKRMVNEQNTNRIKTRV